MLEEEDDDSQEKGLVLAVFSAQSTASRSYQGETEDFQSEEGESKEIEYLVLEDEEANNCRRD